ncbi:MAG: methylmalonyl-CoA mutase family protein [Desulfobacteraceae bacterium]
MTLQTGGPQGGSYYVEWLTDEIEKRAMDLIQEIEKRGGFVDCWESGYIRSFIEESAQKWKEAGNRGKRVVVGMNKYVMEEEHKVPVYRIDPETERIQEEGDIAYKKGRDGKRHNKAMKDLEEAPRRFNDGDNDHSLIPRMIEAARCDATNGELAHLMRKVLGWVDSAVLVRC